MAHDAAMACGGTGWDKMRCRRWRESSHLKRMAHKCRANDDERQQLNVEKHAGRDEEGMVGSIRECGR